MVEHVLVERTHSVCYFMRSLVDDHAVMCRRCGHKGPIATTKEKAISAWNAEK